MGAMLFVLPYLVIGNVLALNAAALAERWLYFSGTGAILILGVALAALADLAPGRQGRTRAVALGLLLVVAFGGVALYTRRASRMWENNIAFFSQNLRATPKSLRAYVVLARRHRENGELDAALQLHRRALRNAPEHVPFWIEKGATLWRMGRLEAAEQAFRRAVELRPDMGQAQLNLGLILARRDAVGEAERALRKALVYEPYLVRAAEELGNLAFRTGRYKRAAHYYRGCVRLGREDLRPKLAAAARLAAEASRR
jgi:tetratricopeptide (TPR) repeat protein